VAVVLAGVWFFRTGHVAALAALALAVVALYPWNGSAWALLALPVLAAAAWQSADVPRYRWAFWAYYPGHLAVMALVVLCSA
jgi:hypothetical protein